ncbi:MAG: glycogen synthase GlgA [Candidatus Aureabacteria bacterium]|nr:glycogen synthase GlgA [Candidatus Auribacterota bacterium]
MKKTILSLKKDKIKTIIAASEVVPFAKTGGLADVAGALPAFLEEHGTEVVVIMPYYSLVKKGKFKVRSTGKTFHVKIGAHSFVGEFIEADITKKSKIYFIKNDKLYDRANLYVDDEGKDYPDNLERFIFYSRAVLEFMKIFNFKADVIHCNDWQSGLVPAYLKTVLHKDPFYQKVATVFTIHNLAYQGIFKHSEFAKTGLPHDVFSINGIEFYGDMNLLKSGLVYSDILNTVSEKYAQEIQTEDYGCGLNGVLSYRKDDLYGILNGVDYNVWSPEKDAHLEKRYSLRTLSGKEECKKSLIKKYKLKISPEQPLLGTISRLADQKGFDILLDAMEIIVKLGVGFVLLGTGDPVYHKRFAEIAEQYSDRIGVRLMFNNELAHQIEAGCDMFLMPSRYEPCGLNQIYSLKYGTVPIVRATGGLDDTIENYNRESGKGNGFKFERYSPVSLIAKILEAINLYDDKKHWKKIVQNGMKQDFSWDVSASKYVKLYKRAIDKLKNK